MKKIIDIKKLKGYIWSESGVVVTELKESPHYQFLCGEEQVYIHYNQKYAYRYHHTVAGFRQLIKEFDITKAGALDCRLYKNDEYIIRDGFHRACILLYKGYEQVLIEVNENCEKEILIRHELLKVTNYRHSVQENGLCGYHSFNIGNIDIPGQRNPKQRLNEIQKHYNFKNKNVLDLGCSVGGMLFHLEDISKGVGIDVNEDCIKAAKNITKILEKNNLHFIQYDFENNDYEELQKEIGIVPDIVFLLSLRVWIKNWRKVYDFARSFNCPIVLETNNHTSEISELDYFKSCGRNSTLIIEGSPDDITGNNLRKTYLVL